MKERTLYLEDGLTRIVIGGDAGYPWPSNTYVDSCEQATSYKEKRFYDEKRSERKRRKKTKRSWMPWS